MSLDIEAGSCAGAGVSAGRGTEMTKNDVVLLGEMLERHHKNSCPTLEDSESQVLFTAKHYLRHFAPSQDDLLGGIVDGTHDCGVDGVYIFANSMCLRDEVPLEGFGKHAQLDLFLIQVKNTTSFGESPIDKLIVSLPDLLDFGRDEKTLALRVNSRLLEVTHRFLTAYRNLEMPRLRIFVCFASLRAEQLHENVRTKAVRLESVLKSSFASCQPQVDFLDAATLADMAREIPVTTRSLQLAENWISTDTAGGYVAVVKLDDYERFITGENGELDGGLFEANVRDYEGDTRVNKSIEDTLAHNDSDVDFWWLNNGVTIVATKVQPANKLLELESPQVVNGLQTSNEIYKRAQLGSRSGDNRSLLVKVIQADDPKVRDRIIRATNSQTALAPSALRATDKVQRQIEEHLGTKGLYYERRRRYYQNQGLPVDKIVSIDQMGQAVLSVMAQTPHIARGAVSRVFDSEIYDLLFAPSYPIEVYSSSFMIVRSCWEYLSPSPYSRSQAEDFVYHLAMLNVIALTRKNRPSAGEIASLKAREVPRDMQSELLNILREEYSRASRKSGEMLLDRLAKDSAVTKAILDRGRVFLLGTRRE